MSRGGGRRCSRNGKEGHDGKEVKIADRSTVSCHPMELGLAAGGIWIETGNAINCDGWLLFANSSCI